MGGSIIVSGVRTPIGKLGGGLASLSAVELCGRAISEAMARISLSPGDVDFVAIGQVLQAGQGQNPARQAAVLAGLPMTVQAVTVNKVCLSGLEAIHLADLLISAGEADVVIAGGMESMSPRSVPCRRSPRWPRLRGCCVTRRHCRGRPHRRFLGLGDG